MKRWAGVTCEVPSVGRTPQGNGLPVPDCLFFVTVLGQFQISQVRSDYANGAFRLPRPCCDLALSELDRLSRLVLPSLFGRNLRSIENEVSTSRATLDMIANCREGFIHLSSDQSLSRTFEDWHKILISLADCPYWKEVGKADLPSKPERVSSIVTNTDVAVTMDAGVGTTRFAGKDVGIQTESCVSVEEDRVAVCCIGVGGMELNDLIDRNDSINAPHILAPQSAINICSGQVQDKTVVSSLASVPGSATLLAPGNIANVCLPKAHHCSWCHKKGHLMSSCWRKQRLCLICGSQHNMRDCPRFIAPVNQADPVCTSCGGGHLGKDCRKIAKWSLYCHWCGRFGHTEGFCWMKMGHCLICGSPDHMITQCPGFRPRSAQLIFPP